MSDAKLGPNVRKLIAHKMSRDAIPEGGGVKDALAFLTNKDAMIESAKVATIWVQEAIKLIKNAPGNTYGNDDEAIAGEILRKIEAKKAARTIGATHA